MTSSNAKPGSTDEELSKLFEGIEDDSAPGGGAIEATPQPSGQAVDPSTHSEHDLLAELGHLAAERPASRSTTPRLPPSTATNQTTAFPRRGVPASASAGGVGPSVEGAPGLNDAAGGAIHAQSRRSGESTESRPRTFTPTTAHDGEGEAASELAALSTKSAARPPEANAAGAGSWWGGLVATASAAVKTAEAAVKEIQHNEEAKRWAEQVKDNVGALRGLGGELRSRALPTFTNILHTLAPPISAHERLQIHTTHDLVGYPSLDGLIYQVFSRVMSQVEGGDLLVIQRGQDASPRRDAEAGFGISASGWADGPWWRQSTGRRNLGIVSGLAEGTKLVRASAESFAHDFYASRGGVAEAASVAAEGSSEPNPVRTSDIFLAFQAIRQAADAELFGGSRQGTDEPPGSPESKPEETVAFAIYLRDPLHGIIVSTITQTFPAQWVDWLDAPSANTQPLAPSQEGAGSESVGQEGAASRAQDLPDAIAKILDEGGADPREWVAEWMEEVLSLGVGIVAQRYVAKRMGVGEGGVGSVAHGNERKEAVESGGGEAARAI
ncbi:MAG: hypothetical protein M1826_007387 [Phylliscum demangeonii]|nr:MAG: hypothetical protein M1826_007387 [Phylliscum demangeonii]